MNPESPVRIQDYSTAADLPENTLLEVRAGTRTIGLLRRGGQVFAFAATCPHAGHRLCEGWVDARGHIVCPLHHYRFSPDRGYNSSGEGYRLKTFPVQIRPEGIFVTFS